MERLELYSAVVEAIQKNEPLSPEAANWIGEAVFLNAMTGISIDEALGIKVSGRTGRTIRTQYLLTVRNKALRQAWLLIDEDKPWQRSEKLLQEIKVFERSRLWQFGGLPSTKLEEQLHEAFSTELDIPATVNGVHRIVNGEACS